ncbi:hypothetical protein [Streptomyces olivaceoviridis]|uniref:hypothetical protein n=1 Tax=Streptomyces olivaceoviridis TaxID=1921 RepID=UPI0036FD2BFD
MTDLSPRPSARATSKARVAELHRLCREDYKNNADRRTQDHRDDAHLIASIAEAVTR